VRREPRREALSTLEAAALLLKHVDGGSEIDAALLDRLDRLITDAGPPARLRLAKRLDRPYNRRSCARKDPA